MIFKQYSKMEGPCLISLERREDNRGFFARHFCEEEFADAGLPVRWVQMNTSLTRERGTVRGLHFQYPPAAEDKVVRCLAGSVLDVLVDVRAGSATFGTVLCQKLSADTLDALYIPKGFAHGFQTQTNDVLLQYQHSQRYEPDHEGGLLATDPALGIDWPLPVRNLSDRDRLHPVLADIETVHLTSFPDPMRRP